MPFNLKQIFNKLIFFKNKKANNTQIQTTSDENLTIITRDNHPISRKDISENALKALYRLNKNGYEAYLVGGCVRDLLLNLKPKDFDVATNATPEQIKKLFSNSRIIGRRFKIVHLFFGKEIIEVTTFRANPNANISKSNNKISSKGMILRDNSYGKVEEDATRRDFTINCLYYGVKDFAIRDYSNGYQDIQKGIIRLIGDPKTRYQEDPVRMLRALRFKAKLNMQLDDETKKPIANMAHLIKEVSFARLFDESLKLLQSGHGYQTYLLLKEYKIFNYLFPALSNETTLNIEQNNHHKKTFFLSHTEQMIEMTLKNTDLRIKQNKRINPAFLFAAMLWYPLQEQTKILLADGGLTYHDAFNVAMHDIIAQQCKAILIPKRFTSVMCDIWRMQLHFNKQTVKRVYSIYEHPKFRAAYDLLELRAIIEKGKIEDLKNWWKEFQRSNESEKQQLLLEIKSKQKKNFKRKPVSKRSIKSKDLPNNDLKNKN